jgi:hypothetical protein
MAAKRPGGEVTVATASKVKRPSVVVKELDSVCSDELPADVLVDTWNIDAGTTLTLTLDRVFGGMYANIVRTLKSGVTRAVTLESRDINKLQSYGKNILSLSRRYAGKGRNVTFSFHLSPLLKATLDLAGFGYLDIRRFFLARDDTECPTKVGIRIPLDCLAAFCETIAQVNLAVEGVKTSTSNIVHKSKLALMHRELVALENLENSPTGCKEASDWSEVVEKYFATVEGVVSDADVVNLAEEAAPEMGVYLLDPNSHARKDLGDKLILKDKQTLLGDKVFALCARLCQGCVK